MKAILGIFVAVGLMAGAQTKSSVKFTQVVTATPIAVPQAKVKATVSYVTISQPANVGSPLTLYIFVKGVPGAVLPTGTVTVTSAMKIGGQTVQLSPDGVVVCTEEPTAAGSNGVLITYNGDTNYY